MGLINYLICLYGNKNLLLNAIQQEAQKYVTEHGMADQILTSRENPITIKIGEELIQVAGRIQNGIISIGTAFCD